MPDRILTAHDRCDHCGAAAYVRVHLATGSLDFCVHHINEYEDKLIVYPWVDERHWINPKLDVSP